MAVLGRTVIRLAMILTIGTLYPHGAEAQDKFHVFPQFADGRFADGTHYRMTLNVLPWFDGSPASCTLNLYGMTALFENGASGSTTGLNIPAGGFVALRTTGQQSFQSGYATLTCDEDVHAVAVYTFHAASGVKLGEATVLSSDEIFGYTRFIADHRDGARLGVAIANNTASSHTYQVIATINGEVEAGEFTVPARRSLGKFIDELIPFPGGTVTSIRIESLDSSYFYAVGLRFTGSLFTTVPIRN